MTESFLPTQPQKSVASATKNEGPPTPLCQTRKNASFNTAGLGSEEVRAPSGPHRFDAPTSLTKLREQRNKKRRQQFQHSRLNQWRAEIVALKNAGASYREIKAWLASEKRIKVDHSSVIRFVKRLPEMQAAIKQKTREDQPEDEPDAQVSSP